MAAASALVRPSALSRLSSAPSLAAALADSAVLLGNSRSVSSPFVSLECQAKLPDEVVVATDNELVKKAVDGFGGKAMMTSPDHPSGTDRLAEVALNYPDVDVIVNVQGDEPMIPPEVIDRLAECFTGDSELQMATLKVAMNDEDYNNPAAVKVVTDLNGYALYFSRSLMPYPRNKPEGYKVYKHVGIYAYRRSFLLKYAALQPTPLERAESL